MGEVYLYKCEQNARIIETNVIDLICPQVGNEMVHTESTVPAPEYACSVRDPSSASLQNEMEKVETVFIYWKILGKMKLGV